MPPLKKRTLLKKGLYFYTSILCYKKFNYIKSLKFQMFLKKDSGNIHQQIYNKTLYFTTLQIRNNALSMHNICYHGY